MKIAAQLISAAELKFLITESNWENTTLPFNEEQINVELAACFLGDKFLFHRLDAKSGPQTNNPLMFCHEKLTVAKFKSELEMISGIELFEVLLSNDWVTLRKEFTDAYTIAFRDIYNNKVFIGWLKKVLSMPQIKLLMQGLKETGRYHSEDFPEFKQYNHIDEFARHLLEAWWVEKVKGFEEEELRNGTLKQDDVNSPDSSRYKPISFY